MKATIEKITPAKAAQMLKGNKNNRPLRQRYVRRLADQMEKKKWKQTGDPIRFSTAGRLLDGQHRLNAIINSGTTQPMLVLRNVESSVFTALDTGKRRSPADTVAMATGIFVNTNEHSAALTLIRNYDEGTLKNNNHVDNSEIVAAVKAYPCVYESVHRCKGARHIISCSILAACHYLFSLVDENEADRFVGDIIKGSNLKEDCPVFRLRAMLLRNMVSNSKYTRLTLFAMCIKAWNARRTDAKDASLTWRSVGAGAEEFPEVHGI